MKEGKY